MSWGGRRRGFPRAVALAILARDPRCQLRLPGCTGVSTEADHIIPTSQGGTDHPDNGRGLCSTCHRATTQGQAADGIRAAASRGRYPKRPAPGLLSSKPK